MEKIKELSEWLKKEGLLFESKKVRFLCKRAEDKSFYRVKAGDVLGAIAEKFDVSVEAIKSENNLSNDNLQIGQKLIIPESKDSVFYVIKGGDTLSGIAERFMVSVDDILLKNDLSENDTLQIGQEIRVPTAASIEARRKADEERHIRKWSGSDDELMAMTLLGEGGTFKDSGSKSMKEVLTVILNRMKYVGGSLKDIVFAPGQFEFWMKYDPEDIYLGGEWGVRHPKWSEALAIARNKVKDSDVKFSTHYWNPRLVSPSWRKQVRVVHESKHVYGVLEDNSVVYKKVYAEYGPIIDRLKRYQGR